MINYNSSKKIWIIETKDTGYSFGLSKSGNVINSYYGEKLPYANSYPEAEDAHKYSFNTPEGLSRLEYSAWGSGIYTEPCLKVQYFDHVREIELTYVEFFIDKNNLTIVMEDKVYGLNVYLKYNVIDDCDLIERWVEVKNNSEHDIYIENVLSGCVYLPKFKDYRLTYLSGKWAGETQIKKVSVPFAKTVLESRRGVTSHHANSFFAIDKDGLATEKTGSVYFGALAYSGNWKVTIDRDSFNQVKISAGINDFDFYWKLKPEETFITPNWVIGFSNAGFGNMSRSLHKYELKYILNEGNRNGIRKVLYNSWEAAKFNINEKQQIELSEAAASLGIELFVMDDGWFGKRNNDHAGLGDWYVNKEKFPNGLKPLIDKVNSLGMDFGLWVEPEMVNPDSDLYRKHPDWVFHFPNRKRTEIRNQLVLNLVRQDVKKYIFNFMDKLLSENNIKFIKWDMNRSITEPGYPDAPEGEEREVWVKYVQSLYEIVKKLREKHKDVTFQCCASGGGRVDLQALKYYDQFWTSDNTDAFDRLKIQEGFSLAYCAKTMESWVTADVNWVNNRKLSLKYRFLSSMCGNLGIGADILKWNSNEKQEAVKYIELYKKIRHVIQNGLQYRLSSNYDNIMSSVIYVSEDKSEAVLFAFIHGNNFNDEILKVYPDGLDDMSMYEIGDSIVKDGKSIMKQGIKLNFTCDYDANVIVFRKM